MVRSEMAKLYSILLFALALTHATARNIPTDQTTNPKPNALAPAQNTHTSGAPATGAVVGDQKNFISYGGMGGWAGAGGYVGVLPIIGGIGVGGAGGLGGLGKVGGIGVGGGLGGAAGGIIP